MSNMTTTADRRRMSRGNPQALRHVLIRMRIEGAHRPLYTSISRPFHDYSWGTSRIDLRPTVPIVGSR